MKNALTPGAEVLPGYRLVRFIGRGGFGEVWEATAPGNVAKAVKITPVVPGDDLKWARELEGLQRIRTIRHPFLLSIERFEVANGLLVLVMELAEKNLADRFDECVAKGLPGIPRDELLVYLKEASEALDLLNNKHNLFHLDVKPENLFLLGGHVKVADFGLVQTRETGGMRDSIAITPPYAPPEIFDGQVEKSVDQYGLAVTYQEMLTGLRPFSATDVRGIVYQHLRCGPNLAPLPTCDRPVMRKALAPAAGDRYPSCAAFAKALAAVAPFGEQTAPAPVQGVKPRSGVGTVANEAAELVIHAAGRRREKTTALSTTRQPTVRYSMSFPENGVIDSTAAQVQVHFVAFLPLEIFAHKLRGFISDLKAEQLTASPERTVLRFRQRGVFAGRKAVFLQIDTCTKNPLTGYRVVESLVWSTDSRLGPDELQRRGHLLVRYLKAHLMAVDREPLSAQISGAEVRNIVVGA